MSSILKRNAIENIRRLFAGDQILCEQLIDLHLGRLTPEDVKRIREEKEEEAEFILANFPKPTEYNCTYSVDASQRNIQPVLSSPHITNANPEIRND